MVRSADAGPHSVHKANVSRGGSEKHMTTPNLWVLLMMAVVSLGNMMFIALRCSDDAQPG